MPGVRRLRMLLVVPMKFYRVTPLLKLIVLLSAGISGLGQTTTNSPLKLSRRNPDGWFSLRIPKVMGKVIRHADVDGGGYVADALSINYDYWTYENTPNFLRDAAGHYQKPPMLACPKRGRQTRTRRAVIDGKRAIIQRCPQTNERKAFRYIYYVTFPRLKVFNGEEFRYGMFNFAVEYSDKRYLPVAEEIVRSIDFEK